MIRNAVIHIINEQPLRADLYEMPTASDVSLVCTNLRTMNGTRPVFADDMNSVFLFPYDHIRFVEIPPGADATRSATTPEVAAREPAPEPEEEADLEIDEDFLRRIRDA
jgi:hypothetical protein